MKNPTEFLQGFGIGACLITVVAAISLLFRPAPAMPGQAAREAPAEKTAVEPRVAGQPPAL
ncbi:MAG TPA: hypothetical protein VK416_12830, partial [Thermoanaerobaculia bacterium]|nr:hypothetical protein [Thermoanaerobaculia bacterium]